MYLNNSKSESESEFTQSCPTFWDAMDCSLAGSSVHGIFQARVLEWVTISFSIDPGTKPRFPALQADTLPSELPGKPLNSSRRVFKKGKLLNSRIPEERDMYHVPGACVPTTTTIQKQTEDSPGICWGLCPSSVIRYCITLLPLAHSQLKPRFTETAWETSLRGCLLCRTLRRPYLGRTVGLLSWDLLCPLKDQI